MAKQLLSDREHSGQTIVKQWSNDRRGKARFGEFAAEKRCGEFAKLCDACVAGNWPKNF